MLCFTDFEVKAMNTEVSSNTVTWNAPINLVNIYGCTPCPWCHSNHRAGYKKTESIDCDDCGFTVPADFSDSSDSSNSEVSSV